MISSWVVANILLTFTSGQPILQRSWEKYAPKDGMFTILFPGTPKVTEQTTKSQIGEVKVYTATYATSDGNIYMISYSDLPPGATKADNLGSLFEGVREGAKGKDGTVLEDEAVTFEFGSEKYPGHKLELKKKMNEREQLAKLWVIVSDNRLYQIWVIGKGVDKNSFAKSKDATKFLNSFELTK